VSKLKKAASIFAVAFAVMACLLFALVTLDQAKTRHDLENLLVEVDVSDGVDEREAESIAWAYFTGFVSGCGGPNRATLVDDEWIIPASLGYAGRPMESPIRIDTKTGTVSQLGGPSFRSYRSFRSVLLWGIPLRRLMYAIEDF
jgi:hypothetical protein